MAKINFNCDFYYIEVEIIYEKKTVTEWNGRDSDELCDFKWVDKTYFKDATASVYQLIPKEDQIVNNQEIDPIQWEKIELLGQFDLSKEEAHILPAKGVYQTSNGNLKGFEDTTRFKDPRKVWAQLDEFDRVETCLYNPYASIDQQVKNLAEELIFSAN